MSQRCVLVAGWRLRLCVFAGRCVCVSMYLYPMDVMCMAGLAKLVAWRVDLLYLAQLLAASAIKRHC